MRTILAIAAAVLLLAGSGCLGDGSKKDVLPSLPVVSTVDKGAVYSKIQDLLAGVPCTVTSVGDATSANLKLLVNHSFAKGGSQEVDIHGDLMLAAGGGAAGGGFAIINISDPANPTTLSVIGDLGGQYDVKFSPDNATALLGTSVGIQVVDIRDPAEPVKESTWLFTSVPAFPLGPSNAPEENAHMLYTAAIAGKQWVFLAPNSNTGVWILELVGEPGARTLKYVTQTLPVEGGPLGPHDMFVGYDADLKTWLLYSSDGYHGWAVFDIKDPTKPALIGGLVRPETGYTHTIQAAKIGTRRIVATIAEVGVNLLQVYDATNLRAPVLLAAWQVSEQGTPQPVAPQHNFQIVGGKLYLAHYSNGLFVFDLAKLGATPVAGTADLKPMAHYRVSTAGPTDAVSLFGEFWDVVLKDGIVYGSSFSGKQPGVHVIGFGCNPPGDALLTSIG